MIRKIVGDLLDFFGLLKWVPFEYFKSHWTKPNGDIQYSCTYVIYYSPFLHKFRLEGDGYRWKDHPYYTNHVYPTFLTWFRYGSLDGSWSARMAMEEEMEKRKTKVLHVDEFKEKVKPLTITQIELLKDRYIEEEQFEKAAKLQKIIDKQKNSKKD